MAASGDAGYDLADKKCNFLELRSKVGMVFQYPEYQLFAETVEKDVAFGLKNFRKDIKDEKEIAAHVKEALETVGLNYAAVKDRSPFELSGGQKRLRRHRGRHRHQTRDPHPRRAGGGA